MCCWECWCLHYYELSSSNKISTLTLKGLSLYVPIIFLFFFVVVVVSTSVHHISTKHFFSQNTPSSSLFLMSLLPQTPHNLHCHLEKFSISRIANKIKPLFFFHKVELFVKTILKSKMILMQPFHDFGAGSFMLKHHCLICYLDFWPLSVIPFM